MSDSLWPRGLQYTRLLCFSLSPRVSQTHVQLRQCCHPTVSSSVTLFSSCRQSSPAIRVFSNEPALRIRWTKYWSFSFSISPSNKYSGLISFRIDWFDLLAIQGTLKSLLQNHSSKASILRRSAFFMVQFSHPYMTTGKLQLWLYRCLSPKWCLCFFKCCLGLSQLSFQGASIF